jgi:hypothetical protein
MLPLATAYHETDSVPFDCHCAAAMKRNNYVLIVFDSCRYDAFVKARPKAMRRLGKVEKLGYAIYLAKLLGSFARLGMVEDTWALNVRAIDEDAEIPKWIEGRSLLPAA